MRLTMMATMTALALTLTGCGETGDETGDQTAAEENLTPSGVSEVAEAMLLDANGAAHGSVVISQGSDGLNLTVNANGLEPGEHGAHIHAVGSCEAPDFKSAGGHWNPTGKEHGLDNPEGSHFGDFVNLVIADSGQGSLRATIPNATLRDGPNALLDDDGAAFVIHAGRDDQMTDPAGDAGDRVACGVLEIRSS